MSSLIFRLALTTYDNGIFKFSCKNIILRKIIEKILLYYLKDKYSC